MAKLQLDEVLKRGLTSTRAISVFGVAIWLPWGFLRVIYRTLISAESVTAVELATTLFVMSITSIIACWVIRNTLLRTQVGFRSSAWLTFLSYLILIVIVGGTQEIAETYFGTGIGFSATRVATGMFGLYLVAWILDYLDRYHDERGKLHAEQEKLGRIRGARAQELVWLRSDVVEGLRARLDVPWKAITDALHELVRTRPTPRALHDVADRIRNSLIGPVREVSYSIPRDGHQLDPGSSRAEGSASITDAWWNQENDGPTRPDKNIFVWREVGASVPTQHSFYPIPVAATLAILSMSNAESLNLLKLFISNCTFFVVTLILFVLAKRYLTPWLERQNPGTAWVVWLLATFAICLAGTSAAFVVYGNFDDGDLPLIFLGALLATCVAVFVSFLTTIFAKARDATESVLLAVEQTKRESIALQQEIEVTEQEIAHVLHGEVQSMLTSAAFRLDLAAESLEIDRDDSQVSMAIGEVETMLESAAGTISSIALVAVDDNHSADFDGIRERIDELCSSWTGIATIQANIDSETAAHLDTRVNEASLAPVVTDMVREAVLNAIRHAGATEIHIEVTTTGSLCTIIVSNNGRPPVSNVTLGIGLETLNRLDCDWSLSPRPQSGGVLRIELPLLATATDSYRTTSSRPAKIPPSSAQ